MQALRRNWLATTVLAIGGLISALLLWSRRDYVPIWDGRIYADCIGDALAHPFTPSVYRCGGHISESYVALLTLAARLAPNDPAALMAANAVLLLVSAAALWRLMRSAFPGSEHDVGRALVVAMFVVHPIVLASTVQPGLDFGLLTFSLCALAAAVEGRRWSLALFGVLLVFAKEPGVVLYGVITAAWLWRQCAGYLPKDESYRLAIATLVLLALLAVLKGDLGSSVFFLIMMGIVARHPRTPSVRVGKGIALALLREWPLALPVVALAAYMAAYALHRSAASVAAPGASGSGSQPIVWGGAGAGSLVATLLRASLFDRATMSTLALVFVVGFLWVPTLLTLVDLAVATVRFARDRAPRLLPGGDVAIVRFVTVVMVAEVWLLSRFITYSNARYYLVVYPLALFVAYAAIVRLGTRRLVRNGALATLGVLLAVSSVRTIDPVSRTLWGTFDVGTHQMLSITSLTGECCGRGRDQLAYNLEFTRFGQLQDELYERLRPTSASNIVVAVRGDWYTIGQLDSATYRRTLKQSGVIRPRVFNADEAYFFPRPVQSAMYVELPYAENDISLARLSELYDFTEPRWVARDGYALAVRGMRLRPRSLPSPSSAPPAPTPAPRAVPTPSGTAGPPAGSARARDLPRPPSPA